MSRDFPGADTDYLQVGDAAALDITGLPITICAWINLDVALSEQGIVTKWNTGVDRQYSLEITSSGKLGFGLVSNFLTGGTTVSMGDWNHVCARQTSANRFLYLNGSQDGQGGTNSMSATAAQVRLGRYHVSGAPLNGRMAEAAIWNIDLLPGEIAALAKGVSPILVRPQNLKGYWPLWGTGSPERDYSGNANSAVINGSVPAGPHPPVMPFALPMLSPPLPTGEAGFADSGIVYLDLQPSGVELAEYVDAATVRLALTPSAVEGVERSDAATVYLDLQPSGIDVWSPLIPWWDPLPEGENKWFPIEGNKWSQNAQTRFVLSVRGRL